MTAAAALAGSAVTGLFGVRGAYRQAEAAREAGRLQAGAAWKAAQETSASAWAAAREQADAQLEVVRQTQRDQAAAALREVRRTAYVVFLSRIDQAQEANRTCTGAGTARCTTH